MYEATQPAGGKLLNSVESTCDRLDVGRTTVYELIKIGKLKKVKVNGSIPRITEDSIQALLAETLSQVEGA
jgi:excisionase family DNA binding protein